MTTAQERIDSATKKDPKELLKVSLEHEKVLEFIRSVAPNLDPLGVVRVALAHVQATPALRECSIKSIIGAVAEAAKLELTVDGILGHAYLVPFREGGGKAAKMMIGYRGIEQLAYRSGLVTRFHADTIHERDIFHHAEGVVVEFRHERPLGDRGDMIGAYATAHLKAGGPPLIAVMSLEEIHARRARSASFKRKSESSPWTTDFEAMAKKTPIRELGKRIPYPTLQGAALRDEAREEGRATVEDPIDLGEADVTDEPTEGGA